MYTEGCRARSTRKFDVYRSGEVRWFFRGAVPRGVRRWFETGGHGRREPERTDEYLLLPGCETGSVKLRDNKFEIKARAHPPEPVEYTGEVSGLSDTWVKWSSGIDDVGLFRQQFVREEDEWVRVTKKRHLRLISLETGTPSEIPPGRSWLARGCQVEVTDILVRPSGKEPVPAEEWWSLSFESFGDSETLLESLDIVVPEFFVEAPPVAMKQTSSLSYPAWLSRLWS